MGEGNVIFLGWAKGRFEAKDNDGNPYMKDYANIYVFSPVSDFKSEDYEAFGLKAEKKSCVSPDVWKDVAPGEEVTLYFDLKGKVSMIVSTGRSLASVYPE